MRLLSLSEASRQPRTRLSKFGGMGYPLPPGHASTDAISTAQVFDLGVEYPLLIAKDGKAFPPDQDVMNLAWVLPVRAVSVPVYCSTVNGIPVSTVYQCTGNPDFGRPVTGGKEDWRQGAGLVP